MLLYPAQTSARMENGVCVCGICYPNLSGEPHVLQPLSGVAVGMLQCSYSLFYNENDQMITKQ